MNTFPFSSADNCRVRAVIDRLYIQTVQTDPALRQAAALVGVHRDDDPAFYELMADAYMPVTPQFGNLLYALARAARPKTIIEFGTSFGISTLFLAAALRDNGGGRVITTEWDASKAKRAHEHFEEAGLDGFIEIRTGDALETLSTDDFDSVGFVLLDGSKKYYVDVLKLLEPKLGIGCIIASDNSDMSGAGSYLEFVRNSANGYLCAAITTEALGSHHGHEIAVRS
jgi:predicted O-methyltransferase YrrM